MDNLLIDTNTEHSSEEHSQWYVLRDLSRPNAKLPGYKLMENEDVTFFTPMHYVVKQKGGVKMRIKEPVVKNLLFVYASKARLDVITNTHRNLQFCFLRGRSINDPMVVPKSDMNRFIYAVESSSADLVYYTPEEITPDKYGKEVRIIGGHLDGYTGRLLKMRGTKVKKLLVELKGIFIVGVEVDAQYIQFI